MARTTKATPESLLKDRVVRRLKKLEAEGKLEFWRSNAGVGFTKSGFMITFGRKGMSDLLCLCAGKLYCFELKSKTGTLEQSQRELRPLMEAQGASYHVIRSVDDLIAALSLPDP